MTAQCEVRSAGEGDAEAISAVILASLHKTEVKNYPPNVVRRIEQSFSPAAVQGLIADETVLVALAGDSVLGAACLDGNRVRTVFVAPNAQGMGVGRRLVEALERTARGENVPVLVVASSVAAEPFFARLGFVAVRDSYYGKERTVVMERRLMPLQR